MWIRLGAVFGFLAVALGAFGAHGLKDTLTAHQSLGTWDTATQYLMFHALAIMLPIYRDDHRWDPRKFFTAGIVLFSGSLFVLSVTGLKWLGAVTPFGGLCFLAGWVLLVVAPRGDSTE